MVMQRRKPKRILTALTLVLAMLIQFSFNGIPSVMATEVTEETSTEKYIGDYRDAYSVESILTDFQLFSKTDMTLGSHSIGGFAAGGTLTAGTVAEAQYVPSYAGHIQSMTVFQGGTAMFSAGSNKFFYGTKAENLNVSINNGGKLIKNTGYIDFDAAFEKIKETSNNYKNKSQSLDNQVQSSVNGNYIDIDISGEQPLYFQISYDKFNNGAVKLFLNAGENDKLIDLVKEREIVITVVDVGSNDVTMAMDNIRYNGGNNGISNELKKWKEEGEEGDTQIYLEGMKLIWNFPDATGEVTSNNPVSGHILAPNATVRPGGGNMEGGIIANNIICQPEAHFYPYGARSDKELPTEASTTEAPTTELTAEATTVAPTTEVTTTEATTTQQPTTEKQTTEQATTEIPTTEAPTAEGSFSKTDVEESTELPGATLILQYKTEGNDLSKVEQKTDNTTVKLTEDKKSIRWTSGEEAVVLTGLPAGEYLFIEDVAPAGYLINKNEVKFKVDENGKIYLWNDTTKQYDIENSKVKIEDEEITVTISKQIIGNSLELLGAKLTISGTNPEGDIDLSEVNATDSTVELTHSADGKTISWTSGNKAVELEKLPAGDYILHEDTAPAGYEKASDVKFRVDKDGNVFVAQLNEETKEEEYVSVENSTVVMVDESIKATISKKEVGGSAELPGAELSITGTDEKGTAINLSKVKAVGEQSAESVTLTYSDDNTKLSWTSGKEAVVLDLLPVGEYVLYEDTAPAGYEVASDVYFKIDEYGKIYIGEKNGDTISYATTEEAAVVMYDESIQATTAEEVTTQEVTTEKTTTEEVTTQEVTTEKATTEELTTQEPTTEVKTGEGTFSKKEVEGSDELPGATLTLKYETEGNDLSEVEQKTDNTTVKLAEDKKSISWTSGEEAVVLTSLPAGEYVFIEDVAPAGYLKAENEVKFKVDEEGKIHLWIEGTEETPGKYDEEVSEIVEIFDEAIKATISKKAVGGSAELPGAELSITGKDANGEAIDLSGVKATNAEVKLSYEKEKNKLSWTSGSEAVTLEQLPAGEYILHEDTAPAGYEKASEVYFKVDENGKVYTGTQNSETEKIDYVLAENKTVVMYDKSITGEGTFSKVEVEGSEELPGAELILKYVAGENDLSEVTKKSGESEITVSDDQSSIYWTSGTTPVVLSNLPAGEYEFVEDVAPVGYAKEPNVVGFKIDENGQIHLWIEGTEETPGRYDEEVSTIVKIEDESIKATISKKAVGGSAELPGAKLSITGKDANGNAIDLSTVKTTNTSVTLNYSEEDKELSWTSGNTAVELELLPAGEYVLHEDTAPAGYTKESDVNFKVDEYGNVYVLQYNAETDTTEYVSEATKTVVMYDESIKATISKQIAGGSDELPGAKLTIKGTDAEGKVIDLSGVKATDSKVELTYSREDKTLGWTSGNVAVTLEQLPAGEYVLHEDAAPAGYDKASEVKFKVDEDGKVQQYDEETKSYVDTNVVIMYDELIQIETGEGIFSKKAVEGSEELPGAILTLKYTSGEKDLSEVTKKSGDAEIKKAEDNKSITWTSGNEAVILSSLPEGEYEFVEDVAPAGYLIAPTTVKFKVDAEGKIHLWNEENKAYDEEESTIIEIVDEAITVTVSKQIVGGSDELPGAKLTISGKNPAGEDLDLSQITAKNPSVKITHSTDGKEISWTSGNNAVELEKLPAGEYTLQEDTAPAGYTIASEVKFRVDKDGNVQQYNPETKEYVDAKIAVMYDESIEVTISKQIVGGSDELPGAELTLSVKDAETSTIDLSNVVATNENLTIAHSTDGKKLSWVSGDTAVTLSKLPAGEYILQEDTAPAGYTIASDVEFKVDENGKVQQYNPDTKTYEEVTTVVMYDESVPATTEEVTTEAPTTEKATTEATTVEVTTTEVTTTEEVTTVEPTTEVATTEAPTKEVTANATISKKAFTVDGEELPGATLSLTYYGDKDLSEVTAVEKTGSPSISKSADNKVITWTSTTVPVELTTLPVGEYTLKEEGAPNGFAYASDIEIKVDENGKVLQLVDGQYVEVEDSHIKMVDEAKVEDSSQDANNRSSESMNRPVATTEVTTELPTETPTEEETTTEVTTEEITTEEITEVQTTEIVTTEQLGNPPSKTEAKTVAKKTTEKKTTQRKTTEKKTTEKKTTEKRTSEATTVATTQSKTTDKSAKTGDEHPIAVAFGVMLVSCGAAFVLLKKKKEEE